MSKHFIRNSLALALCLSSASLQALTLSDNYVGSDDHGYGDVIGDVNLFGVDGIDLSLSGSTLMLDIHTDFAGRADAGLFADYTLNRTGIGYGDLFLASSWNPAGSAPYLNDDATTGTQWEYVISLDDRWSSSGGTATLYALSAGYSTGDSGSEDVLTSNYFMSGAIFRDNQEVSINTSSSNISALSNGSWSVNTDFIRFEMDLLDTRLLEGDISMHWGPTCANDVIEGIVQVPEPGTLVLMTLGLFGLVGSRKLKP